MGESTTSETTDSTTGRMASCRSSSSSLMEQEVPPFDPTLRDTRNWSIPDWLAARQLSGLHRNPALHCRTSRINPAKMASVVAWNPSRMRNMILSVGPGTPASVLWKSGAVHDENEMDLEDTSDEDSDVLTTAEEAMLNVLQNAEDEAEAAGGGHDDDDSDSDEEMDGEASRDLVQQGQQLIEQAEEGGEAAGSDHDSDESSSTDYFRRRVNIMANSAAWNRSSQNHPSIRHGGCINTACWMDCSWQLCARGDEGSVPITSQACPTQLITSGDDRLVKIWDVKDAMGMANPIEGGWDTFTPLASCSRPDSDTAQKTWKNYYRTMPNAKLSGGVVHLATMVTGHRGNVFHATPVDDQPGKILTCGADGSLRLCDLQAETSSIVVSYGDRSHYLFHSAMAFSHVFLTRNTGLVCSEEGLHRFDLRLPPREQAHDSVLSGVDGCFASNYCKSCTVWSPHMEKSERSVATDGGVEASYVFAGGRSSQVVLLDLRAPGENSRVVEKYQPRGLVDTKDVSVSGLDVSKDSQELLVSYESDQIYSFPILQDCYSKAGPTLQEIDSHAESPNKLVHELGAYGGHFNRFTFLKNARYAGPNDEYICTGSDSGCAWIYDRKSGATVSLLGADKCTCNGVFPHPTLPFFISYGIDSTAKLWRATPPVNLSADDSPIGRALRSQEQGYEMSPVVRSWHTTRKLVERESSPGMLPDYVANPRELASNYRFSPRSSICPGSSTIFGNALLLMPSILRRNCHECYRALQRSEDPRRSEEAPIKHPAEAFSHRVSISRLRLQADQLGLVWNPAKPWAFETRRPAVGHKVHPADMVPQNPSDWLLLDGFMTGVPYTHKHFNEIEYGEVIRQTFPDDPQFFSMDEKPQTPPWLESAHLPDEEEVNSNQWVCSRKADDFTFKSRQAFLATLALLKTAGNEAMHEGLPFTAARRYDLVIQYCAVALMRHEQSKYLLKHLAVKDPVAADKAHDDLDMGETKKTTPRWSSLIQLLVSTRLNLALLLLKPQFTDPARAVDQAKAALGYLKVFTKKSSSEKNNPEILALQAKANFRMGSAKFELGNYSDAVNFFEASLKDSRELDKGKPDDALVLRRLVEAKKKLKSKKKRDRKKYERALHLETAKEAKAREDD